MEFLDIKESSRMRPEALRFSARFWALAADLSLAGHHMSDSERGNDSGASEYFAAIDSVWRILAVDLEHQSA